MARSRQKYFAYRSFWPELDTMKKFRDCGVDTFAFTVSNTVNSLGLPYSKYPPVWKWNQLYDFDAFDQQVGDILEAIPDARLICMLDLNTPQWWTRYLGAYGVRYDSYYELGKISASQTWRVDTVEYMQAVIQYAEKHHPQHIVAYTLGCGGAHEWHDRSRGEESVYRLAAYRKWQREHGRPVSDIPGRLIRDAGSHDFDDSSDAKLSYFNGIDPTGCYSDLFPNGYGLFRTPGENSEAIDYWRFCNDLNLDAALHFVSKSREVMRPEVELGMFFGYVFSGQWSQVSNGHLEYERLLDAPGLDFLVAPISYAERQMGGGGGERIVNYTTRSKGKRILNEMDQRTHTTNHRLADYCELPDPLKASAEEVEWDDTTSSKEMAKKFSMASFGIWKNEAEVIAGIKREAAFSLIRESSLWWFDMWGGFYKGEAVFDTFKQLKKIWDEEVAFEGEDVSEVLLVIDPHNLYYVNDMDARVGLFHGKTRDMLNTIGSPHNTCSFNDLATMDLHNYKLVIMCHPFELTDRHQQILKDKVCCDDRHVAWVYGPGIINDGQWDTENVFHICGISYATPGIHSVPMEGWTSVYIHEAALLTPALLREIASNAGCHFYCEDLRPVCANSRLVAVHTGMAENLKVSFTRQYSRVTELFSDQSWNNACEVQLKTKGPESFLLRLENGD